MQIAICDRSKVAKTTSKVGATHVLSLLDPGKRPFLHPKTNRQNCRLFHFEDNLEPGPNSPTRDDVEKILDWAKQLPENAILLVHCEAGVSRSTAVALAILVQHLGNDKIEQAAQLVLQARPRACPNELISSFADDILGCNGKLFEASEAIVELWLKNNKGFL